MEIVSFQVHLNYLVYRFIVGIKSCSRFIEGWSNELDRPALEYSMVTGVRAYNVDHNLKFFEDISVSVKYSLDDVPRFLLPPVRS